MRLAALVVAGVLGLCPAAFGQPATTSTVLNDRALLLVPNERVTLLVDGAGGLKVLSRAPITEAQFTDGMPLKPGEAPEGSVTVALVNTDKQALLRVDNRGAKGLDYAALIMESASLPARAVPTSVCTVRRGISAMETWAGHGIPALVLTQFKWRPTEDGVCESSLAPPPRTPASPPS